MFDLVITPDVDLESAVHDPLELAVLAGLQGADAELIERVQLDEDRGTGPRGARGILSKKEQGIIQQ